MDQPRQSTESDTDADPPSSSSLCRDHMRFALKKVLDNPGHRDLGRALGIVSNRMAPVRSTAAGKVEGEVMLGAGDTAVVLDRIEELS